MDLVKRVQAERGVRSWSARKAAAAGAVSNTTWSAWESDGGEPSAAMRDGVALAFGWAKDWPENPPPMPLATEHEAAIAELRETVSQLVAVVGSLGQQIRELADANRQLHEQTGAKVDALAKRLPPAGGQRAARRAQ